MELFLLAFNTLMLTVLIVLVTVKSKASDKAQQRELQNQLQKNREELRNSLRELRMEMMHTLTLSIKQLQDSLHQHMLTQNTLQQQNLDNLARQQENLVRTTEKHLEDTRLMVEERLQNAHTERLGRSFAAVSTQLESVQKGLGEMKSLAQSVGSLKNVLGNIKIRGTIGEIQLGALLEQMLSPGQYAANVKTKRGSSDFVEYAIKLPRNEGEAAFVYLPVDAKFPKDVYEQYCHALETGNAPLTESANRQFETTLRKMANDIHSKYIDPPYTTEFAIMFLPFESIYAEVIRRSDLLETLQQKFKVIVTGPSTLGAILNSLQLGFRTLAIQKRSGEVWKVLGAVKTEFDRFHEVLTRAQKQLTRANNELDTLIGVRTRRIQSRLKDVTAMPAAQVPLYLPEDAVEIMDTDDEEKEE